MEKIVGIQKSAGKVRKTILVDKYCTHIESKPGRRWNETSVDW